MKMTRTASNPAVLTRDPATTANTRPLSLSPNRPIPRSRAPPPGLQLERSYTENVSPPDTVEDMTVWLVQNLRSEDGGEALLSATLQAHDLRALQRQGDRGKHSLLEQARRLCQTQTERCVGTGGGCQQSDAAEVSDGEEAD